MSAFFLQVCLKDPEYNEISIRCYAELNLESEGGCGKNQKGSVR